MSDPVLNNYRALLAKVDALCTGIAAEKHEHIVCRPGCDACCRHLSLFPVEAAFLGRALRALPAESQEVLRRRAAESALDGPCPLLAGGLCQLYAARPIICRTHGLPILYREGQKQRVDFCPENFQGVASLPAAALIDLEKLNQLLASVNALYLRDTGLPEERVSIAAALLAD